ncbi:MAG: hypothetical protein CFE32_05560 [Alphaproteobacteria bacterium PA3]|nr:MAG: hypothetical protein CFE32_05560 [Alphaproteobacteria bacterium PA3]
MTHITEHFPLIGTRDYIHSTTLLAFLDRFQPPGQPPASIDLRLREKVLPGVRVLADGTRMQATAAASALIGGRWVNFVNAETPAAATHVPDLFASFLPDIRQKDATTMLRPCITHPDDIWPRLVCAAKRHLEWHHIRPAAAQNASTVLLTRISCQKPDPADFIFIKTEITMDSRWFRLGISTEHHILGCIFGTALYRNEI